MLDFADTRNYHIHIMVSELTERRPTVPPEEVGKPLSQEDMYELLNARKENMVLYQWFLSHSRAREVFEGIRSDNQLIAAEILETIEQPDASEIKLELRWPVKSGVVEGKQLPGRRAIKTKSFPATYNYVTVNFHRVQTEWSPDYGTEPAWAVSIEGEGLDSILWAESLRPVDIEAAIQRSFSNPKTKDFETPEQK
ncbi:MAG: hypothetical protein UX88_C0026G0003 [Candidatus Woesebacteria bacterium GW2011_GWC2_47_16]|uniref:Uncharacterized protein n=6 Tax=Candidatus Woeseibacteriota TaxID=1752722 RepID=A0A1F8D218_9BACT|nr:MAG: hypothetical protein UX03_C0009G0017 [Candidatus Woesebacteria bacterium GW2011_GWE1_45_18]KKU63554.1 MAG: hypothetical protein UX88_C0026G0003 [Candidatus Woesebacteria bacterium GW2011_GWC2_47_16]OGM82644.1 MAG: hypothetical protein A2376_00800 [Candidatus Woesebacteria bacterium RIFOXYB1_FULL_47_31]OGM84876.1 MAG: hypothetical protein A2435_00525 [Candidatus Woesebacteria bacterium RIFOXYC1_FULL_46_16]OGM89971.1 MAG: hypothetical protein A2597_01000 [Candidatus Woesebacteria bacteriu